MPSGVRVAVSFAAVVLTEALPSLPVDSGSAEEEMDASNGLLGRRATSSVICFGSIAMDLVTETDMFPTPNSHQKGASAIQKPPACRAHRSVVKHRLSFATHTQPHHRGTVCVDL